MRCFLVTALAIALPAQQVVAPGSARHGAIVANKDGLTLPAGEFTVAELIDAVAAFLCRNYLYDQDDVARAAGFTLHRSISLDAIGSEELLHALLAARDLAAIPIDEHRGVHQVVALAPNGSVLPAIGLPWRSPDEILARPRFHELVMTAVELRNVDAQQLANALRTHFSVAGPWRPGMLMACASEPRTLLLHGYRDQIAQILLLARHFDRAVAPSRDEAVMQRLEALEAEVAELKAQLAVRPR